MRPALALSFLALALPAAAQVATPYAEGPCPAVEDRIAGWIDGLGQADGAERDALVAALVRIGRPAWPHLIEATSADDYEVRAGAVRALGAGASPEAVDALVAVARDEHRTINLRVLAVESLGGPDRAAAVGPLLGLALGEDSVFRAPAVQSLSAIRRRAAVDALLEVAAARRDLRDLALAGLSDLTGRSTATDTVDAWRRWWAIARHTDPFDEDEEDVDR